MDAKCWFKILVNLVSVYFQPYLSKECLYTVHFLQRRHHALLPPVIQTGSGLCNNKIKLPCSCSLILCFHSRLHIFLSEGDSNIPLWIHIGHLLHLGKRMYWLWQSNMFWYFYCFGILFILPGKPCLTKRGVGRERSLACYNLWRWRGIFE